MSSASIKIEQAGVAGAAGKSRDDLVLGQPVTLRNANDADVRSWRWTLALPSGSSATLSNVTAAAPTFTPDVPGTYVVGLAVDQGNTGQTDTRLAAVRNADVVIGPATFSTRFFGVGESDEANWNSIYNPGVPNTSGYWEDLDQWLHMLLAASLTAGSDTTEAITDPSLVEAGSAITLSMGDRAAKISDPVFPSPPLDIFLPTITPGDAGLGHRCSIVLEDGNANRDIVINGAASQGSIDPATGLPDASVVFPAGTFAGYAVLTWEAVPALVPPLPATVIPPLVPDFEPAPPNFAPIPVTISGTGGTLPAPFDLIVSLSDVGPPILLTVTSAVQGGGPGTPWTIIADIPAFALGPGPANFDLSIVDISGGPGVVFARLFNAFSTVFGPPVPSQPVSDVWLLDTTFNAGAAGGSRWDEVLAAGPNTNGEDGYVILEDGLYWSTATSPLVDPTVPPAGLFPPGLAFADINVHEKSARAGAVPSIDGLTWTTFGSAIFTAGFSDDGPQNRIHIRAVMTRRLSSPGGVPNGTKIGVLEEIWTYSYGAWGKDATIVSSAEIAGYLRIAASGPSIYVQAIDDAVYSVDAFAAYDRTILRGWQAV